MANSANNNIPYVPQNTLDPASGLNEALRIVDALLNTRVQSIGLNDPPGATGLLDGEMYIVGTAPTGAWAGHANAIAQWVETGSSWNFYEAGDTAWIVYNVADGNLYKWDAVGTSWVLAAGIPDAPADGSLYGRKDLAWVSIPDVTNAVFSVNGQGPDSNGNVVVGDVSSVIGITPDTSGDVVINTNKLDGINDQSGTAYTLAATDAGKDVRCTNAAAITVTVPLESTTPFSIGQMIVVSQGGAGAVSIVPENTTMTMYEPNGNATSALGDARVLEYLGSDEWRIW